MSVYLYFSLLPEALVGSMLPPEEFGRHLALGAGKRTRAQAIFFEVDRDQAAEHFHLSVLDKRCVPHPDGRPHRSCYVSIYRVLERLPISALKKLYLTTRDGTTIGLSSADLGSVPKREGFHFYQEFCPVTPRVVARLDPREFGKTLTTPENAVFIPRLVFADFRLDGLATDPHAAAQLPYRNLAHIRFCLEELQQRPEKVSKIVDRDMQNDVQYWMIENGVFVSDNENTAFYPVPQEDELRARHPDWWSSSRAVELM